MPSSENVGGSRTSTMATSGRSAVTAASRSAPLSTAAAICTICRLPMESSPRRPRTSSTAKHTVNPILNIVLGALILLVVFVVGTGRDTRRRARSERKREAAKTKPMPRWRRQLSKGSARDTFVVGILLSFPGASYVAGMDLLHKQNTGTAVTVLVVLAFNVISLALLEIPLIGYAIAPDQTAAAIERFSSWLTRRGGRFALMLGAAAGVLLILRGIVNW